MLRRRRRLLGEDEAWLQSGDRQERVAHSGSDARVEWILRRFAMSDLLRDAEKVEVLYERRDVGYTVERLLALTGRTGEGFVLVQAFGEDGCETYFTEGVTAG